MCLSSVKSDKDLTEDFQSGWKTVTRDHGSGFENGSGVVGPKSSTDADM